MSRNYKQGIYQPRNPGKYAGDVSNIVYRSSWEAACFKWLDNHPSVVAWGSEEVVIPYVSPVDNKQHRYFVDLVAKFKLPDGKFKIYLIEIKPDSQTRPPSSRTRDKQRLLTESKTYVVNQAKWEAAKAFCDKKGWEFIVLTENEIFARKKT